MASSLDRQELRPFIDDYERLIRFLRSSSDGVRLVFLSPIGRLPFGGQAGPGEDETHSKRLAEFSQAIKRLAEQNDSAVR